MENLQLFPESKQGLVAEHSGVLTLGDFQLPCFVLSDESRVITMREVVFFLTGNKKGGLERYTNSARVRDYMPKKFVDTPHVQSSVTFYVSNRLAYGYTAEDIIDIMDAYLKADDDDRLLDSQKHLARKAGIFLRSCAKLGLTALIDEATGYQEFRRADDLQVKLNAYIAQELNEWTKTFPEEFFDHLYKLEGLEPPRPTRAYPKRFGKYVMHYVYDTLDPDVADWLRTNNPNPSGRRHHFQWLTDSFGYKMLSRHLWKVVGIQAASKTQEDFKRNLATQFPHARVKRRARLNVARAERTQKRMNDAGQYGLFENSEMEYLGKKPEGKSN